MEIITHQTLDLQDPVKLLKWQGAPVLWAEELLSADLEKFQKEALEHLVEDRFVAMSCGSGVGKTVTMAIAGLWFVSTHLFALVPCTAPTASQLNVILWREFRNWMNRAKDDCLNKMLEFQKRKIVVRDYPDEWYIVARTAKVDEAGNVSEGLSGFHPVSEGKILILADESSGIHEKVFSALEGSLSTPDSYMMMSSNPTRNSGTFYRAFHQEQELWHTITVASQDSKYSDPSYPKRYALRFGVDSDVYRVKVLGLFPKQASSEHLFSESDINTQTDPTMIEPQVIVIGLDVARFGDDLTAFLARRGYRIFEIQASPKMDTVETADWTWLQIMKYLSEFPGYPIEINIDAIGYGAGVYDLLKKKARMHNLQEGLAKVTVRAIFSYGKSNDKLFYNVRSEMYFTLKDLLRQLKFEVVHPRLGRELEAISHTFSERDGKVIIRSKDEIKKELGFSPDFADALALCCYSTKKLVYPAAPVLVTKENKPSSFAIEKRRSPFRSFGTRRGEDRPSSINWSGGGLRH